MTNQDSVSNKKTRIGRATVRAFLIVVSKFLRVVKSLLVSFLVEVSRFERIKTRNREDDTTDYEVFAQRDKNELGFGIGEVIALSDKLIVNESDLESHEKEIRKFLEEFDI